MPRISSSRFFSLKQRAIAAVALLFTAGSALLGACFYQQFQGELSALLAATRQEQSQALARNQQATTLLERSFTGLAALRLKTATPAPTADTEAHLEAFAEALNQDFDALAVQWDLAGFRVYDSSGKTIAESGAGFSPTLTSKSPFSCAEKCFQHLTVPLFHNNRSLGHWVLARPFEHTANEVARANNNRLYLLSPNESGTEAANWQGRVLNGDADLASLLAHAGAHPSSTIRSKALHFADGDNHYALSIFSQTEAAPFEYLMIKDISGDYRAFVQNVVFNAALAAAFLLLLLAGTAVLSWRYNNQVYFFQRVFRDLNDKQFQALRKLVSRRLKHSWLQDERSALAEEIRSFSFALESLDQAVDVRAQEMERLALFDSLTGLANRNLLQYELQRDVQRFSGEGGMLAVVVLDLDRFKRINDTLGHQVGDRLLAKIGMRLKNATGGLGLVARLGGDEFAIILRSAKKFGQLELLCQKVLDLVHKPVEFEEHSIVISCSLGLALAGSGYSHTDLLRHAEIAMYKAKENGGNGFRLFNAAMAREAHANLSLEAELRQAFEQKEFTLYLQPKVDMDGEIRGFESLIRWDHPERGIVPPGEFIPALENLGLISHLDNLVLETSCRQLKVLQNHYPDISIAVNISSLHFTDKNFLAFLKDCLAKYPIDPSRLELEITETLLMKNMTVGMAIIRQIKELGVSIAIDDFGTGYSSLSYLKKLPVDTIKIDREFIKDIPESESDMQISSVIIFLAKQLHFKVVAEGVETAAQLAFLKANDCDLAQGFLFSKPIPAHKATLMLESRRDHDTNSASAG